MRLRDVSAVIVLFLVVSAHGHAQARRPAQAGPRHTPQSAQAATDSATQYKGIFEPVNYGQDINFTDVFFVSPDVGWVSGEHATILKTTDGGAHWIAQVGGDASGTEQAVGQLRFLDARHGWAVTGDQHLLRTMDGENWEQIGEQPARGSSFVDYAFTSVRHGIALGGNMGGFYVTNDGGRHWQNVTPCKVSATVQGLPRTEDCRVKKLQMLSAQSGYASADWSGGLAFLRTDDGGQHWTSIANNVSECCEPDFFFTDLNHGVMTFNSGKTYLTDDGARSWHPLLSGSVGIGSGNGHWPVRFADPEVGWVIAPSPDNSRTSRMAYSADRGRHWKSSQNLAFPVETGRLKFSFPRRDRAYVVGDHGMIYRYRVVAANYTAANVLDAPLMPGFGGAELSVKADAVRKDLEALRGKLAALTTTTSPDASATAAMAGAASAEASASTGAAANGAPGSAGFTQPADVSATANAIASGDSGSASFSQDTSPASDFFSTCCAADMQQLQADTSGFVAQIPPMTSQTRPLNLIVAGLQLVATLMNQGQSLWNQFKTLKHAPNPQAASAALQQLSTTLNTVQQASSTGLQDPGGWFASNAPATFTQDIGTGPGGTGAVLGNAISGGAPQSGDAPGAPSPQGAQPQSSGNQPQNPGGQNPAQNSVDQTVDKAKQKIKSKLKWPPM